MSEQNMTIASVLVKSFIIIITITILIIIVRILIVDNVVLEEIISGWWRIIDCNCVLINGIAFIAY